MDLDKPVLYRGLDLNQKDPLQPAMPLSGFVLNEARFEPVEGWGFREKRSLTDGYDASDIFLGMRTIYIRGTIYTRTKAQLHDRVRIIRRALTPTLAYAQNPGDKGFLPFAFSIPTEYTDDWPSGFIDLVVLARPADQPGFYYIRDAAYGKGDGYSIPYEARLECKDPHMYHPVPVEVPVDALSASGQFIHRGDYPAALNLVIRVPASDSTEKVLVFTGASTRMTVTVPSASKDRYVRVDGVEKVCTYEVDGGQTLRMDLVEFEAGFTWPRVNPGVTDYDWLMTGGLPDTSASKFIFYETFC